MFTVLYILYNVYIFVCFCLQDDGKDKGKKGKKEKGKKKDKKDKKGKGKKGKGDDEVRCYDTHFVEKEILREQIID
jgi:hypothetical protein